MRKDAKLNLVGMPEHIDDTARRHRTQRNLIIGPGTGDKKAIRGEGNTRDRLGYRLGYRFGDPRGQDPRFKCRQDA